MNTRTTGKIVAGMLMGALVLAGGCRDDIPSGVKAQQEVGVGPRIVGSIVQTTEIFREDGTSLSMPATSVSVNAQWSGGRAVAAVGKVPLALGVSDGSALSPTGIRAFAHIDAKGKRGEYREYREVAGGPVSRTIFFAEGEPVLAVDAKWHRASGGWELERQTIESYVDGRRTTRITYVVRSKGFAASSAIDATPLLASASFGQTILSRPATMSCDEEPVWNRASTTTASGGAPSFACYEDGSDGPKCVIEGTHVVATGIVLGVASAALAAAIAGTPVSVGATVATIPVALAAYGMALSGFVNAVDKFEKCKSPTV